VIKHRFKGIEFKEMGSGNTMEIKWFMRGGASYVLLTAFIVSIGLYAIPGLAAEGIATEVAKETAKETESDSNLEQMEEIIDRSYRIGVGEVLSIHTFNEPDLTFTKLRLSREGIIHFPLIGKVEALGKSITQIREEIESRLRDGYLKQPRVTVTIEEFREFFINGQVKRPGAYNYAPGMTIRKAISISGGLTDRASLQKIRLKKESGLKDVQINNVDMVITPGDVITIGESLF